MVWAKCNRSGCRLSHGATVPLPAVPRAPLRRAMSSHCSEVPPGFRLLQEGSASILYEYTEGQGDKGEPVFYNKVQVLNRDLSIRMLTLFARHRAIEANLFKIRNTTKRAKAASDLLAGRVVGALTPSSNSAGNTPSASSSGGGGGGGGGSRGAGGNEPGRAGPESPASELAKLSPAELDAKMRAGEVSNFKGIRVLDALAATGLRSIRYFKEIPGVSQVVVNDLEQDAVDAAKRNVEFNGCTLEQVSPRQGDANMAMLSEAFSNGQRYDVIDLDPYGSAAPFLDAAVQAVADGGMLSVTCTDMAVLSGNDPQTCYAKYRSMPTHGKYLHENALRILLHALETSACRYRRTIVPIISCSIDFYIRVFVRVFESPGDVKTSCMRESYVLQSTGCPSFFIQPAARRNGHSFSAPPLVATTCPQTGTRLKLGGPFWGDPIHDMDWVKAALRDVTASSGAEDFPPIPTKTRLHGLLTAVSEELVDVPLYYTMPALCETLHCTSPKWDEFRSAIVNAGYRISGNHKVPHAIKTDAPDEVVWDIMRCWVKRVPLSGKRSGVQSHGNTILSKEPTLQADFSRPKAARFPPNPEEMWGPKSRARRPNKRAAEHGEESSDQSKKLAVERTSASAAGEPGQVESSSEASTAIAQDGPETSAVKGSESEGLAGGAAAAEKQ